LKEWLTAREVVFESIDVANDAGGFDALTALGPRTVPVVAVGDRWVNGIRLDQVAALVGLTHDDTPTLKPATLVRRLDLVLETAMRLTAQIPADRLGDALPHRDRSYLSLANHLVEIAVGFIEVTEGAELTADRAAATPPVDRDLTGLAARATTTRSAIGQWWATTADQSCSIGVETFAGTQDLHRVLERTTWHCAQHTRQLAMVVESLHITPDRPLTAATLEGLPLPNQVWD
jgi:hypothetical protein